MARALGSSLEVSHVEMQGFCSLSFLFYFSGYLFFLRMELDGIFTFSLLYYL